MVAVVAAAREGGGAGGQVRVIVTAAVCADLGG